MDSESLAQLIGMSRAVGVRPDLVQGGGGNTSVKSADGRTMAVKASGTGLAQMDASAGWVELGLRSVLSILDVPGLADLAAAERESRILALLRAAVAGGPDARPSCESILHAMLGRVVLHTHPTAVNALTCGPGQAALIQLVRSGEPVPLWIPYTDPGYTLAATVKKALATYEQEHRRPAHVLLLENHGIFVSADTVEQCIEVHNGWVARCEKYFGEAATPLRPAPAPDRSAVRETMAAIRRMCHERKKGAVLARLSTDAELTNAACDSAVGSLLARGVLTPDHLVYAGAYSIFATRAAEVAPALQSAMDEPGCPHVVLVKNVGAILVSNDPVKLDVVESVASSAAQAVRMAQGRGGAHHLDHASAQFIIDWETEHYRANVGGQGAGPLAGRVAVVTGAASGLGLGIAQGLLEAGAAVAFCDIDEPGLRAATQAVQPAARALAVKMDVTSENAVQASFDQVVRHWGGVDIVVCAAGIAPPYDLVDMPVDKWRLALEINLTGYFLVAREGARVMKAQGQGGSMVMVSSKSGLDASKANSAYNATKAGELHLMRGWALELGRDGIRCNAVAPGNVFEGSKIWNPDYIKACAKKKGIEPEEVIPHYVSMTALNREIKRADVANAVVFLCSDQARCITGQTLVVDSGQVFVR